MSRSHYLSGTTEEGWSLLYTVHDTDSAVIRECNYPIGITCSLQVVTVAMENTGNCNGFTADCVTITGDRAELDVIRSVSR